MIKLANRKQDDPSLYILSAVANLFLLFCLNCSRSDMKKTEAKHRPEKGTSSSSTNATSCGGNGGNGCCLWKSLSRLVSVSSLLVVVVAASVYMTIISKFYLASYHSPLTLNGAGGGTFCNFDREVCCTADDILFPATVSDVISAVTSAKGMIRVVGGGHSMSELVCDTTVEGGSAGSALGKGRSGRRPLTLLSLDRLQRVLSVDRGSDGDATVEVEGGIRLIELNKALKHLGLALRNMGMIQEQSISGLIATGTHGTGIKLPSVSNAVLSMDIVLKNGTVITANATHNSRIFAFSRIHLGLLGVVVRLTLSVTESFQLIREHKFVSVSDAVDQFQQNIATVDHYQMWWVTGTDLVFENRMMRLSSGGINQQIPPHAEQFDRRAKVKDMLLTDTIFSIMTGLSALIPVLGPMMLKLLPLVEPERIFFGDSSDLFTHPGVNYHSVRYTEMEYFVPAENAMACFKAYIAHVNSHMSTCPVNTFSPVRTIRGDELPLSPNYHRPGGSFSISYVLVNQHHNFERCAREVEQIFLSFGGRPHWGKVHYLDFKLVRQVYKADDVDEFAELVREVDPEGSFTTDRLQSLFWV